MKKKHCITVLAAVLTVGLMGGILAGCGSRRQVQEPQKQQSQTNEKSGVICLKVNPEIAVSYDENGMVTKVVGRNDDGKKVITQYEGYEGKACRDVISELVAKINDAGYFVEETGQEKKQITLEIEAGSYLPGDDFLKNIVAGVQEYTASKQLPNSVAVEGESNYGWTNYGDTDYGPDNDGVTDYSDTDYGPDNDGVTDYGNSDYGPNNDGVTDYNDNGATNYDDNGTTNYDDNGTTNYDDSGNTNYDDNGNTNYDDNGTTNYDDGNSGYDD